jgi:hypothetical protein
MHVRRTILLATAALLASQAAAEDAQQQPSDKSQPWYQKDAEKARQLGQEGVDATKQGADRAAQELNAGGQAATSKVVGTKTVTGQVADVSQEQVTVNRNDGTPMQLRVTPSTKVTVRGQSASVASLQRGDEVRASYAQSGGSATATQIDVNPPAGASSGTGSGGGAGSGSTGSGDGGMAR